MDNKVFQHSLHRELWQWLADNPEKSKGHWPRWKHNGGTLTRVAGYCFACEYAKLQCDQCPLCWNKGDCEFAEYGQWVYTWSDEERTRLALLIKDLPVKDGVVTE